MKMRWLCWLLLVPVVAVAGIRDDYARQWPLQPGSAEAGAYRVTLTPEIYRQAHSLSLADVDVVNAEGAAVPSALFQAQQPLAQPPTTVEAPWFPLPAGDARARDIAAISEIASDGSLRRVVLRDEERAGAPREYLIDASRLRQPIAALQLQWAAEQAPFEYPVNVLVSDDLKTWRMAQSGARLIELENQGRRLVERRIPLTDPVSARYLRLTPLRSDQPPLRVTDIRIETAERAGTAVWQWRELVGKRVKADDVEGFEFHLDGRFPIERADVSSAGNSTNEWTLLTRESEAEPWLPATGPWLAFQVADGRGQADRSPPQPLERIVRNRQWRLVPRNPVTGDAPHLRLGYLPEVLVFVAHGQPPFSLLAGSARARRGDAPVPQLVDALRRQRGDGWQPADAQPGASQPLAGAAALEAPAQPRDWKGWLLWGLLIAGALLVAGFAFSLLKRPSPP